MTPSPALPELLKPATVARTLGLSTVAVYKLAKRGDLPHILIGEKSIRFSVEDLVAYIAARRR